MRGFTEDEAFQRKDVCLNTSSDLEYIETVVRVLKALRIRN